MTALFEYSGSLALTFSLTVPDNTCRTLYKWQDTRLLFFKGCIVCLFPGSEYRVHTRFRKSKDENFSKKSRDPDLQPILVTEKSMLWKLTNYNLPPGENLFVLLKTSIIFL